MHSPSKKAFFANYVFNVWENVYEPAEDSFLFAENLVVREGDVVIDIGTGCGILSIIAARKASKIVAVDINPYAVRCAKENAKLNHVIDKMVFVQGDLLTSFRGKGKFDLILFNAPYLPVEHEVDSWSERAWSGGLSGRQVIDRFILEAPKHLKRDGQAFLMQSTLADINKTLVMLKEQGLKTSVVAERSLPFFETIVLLKAERSG